MLELTENGSKIYFEDLRYSAESHFGFAVDDFGNICVCWPSNGQYVLQTEVDPEDVIASLTRAITLRNERDIAEGSLFEEGEEVLVGDRPDIERAIVSRYLAPSKVQLVVWTTAGVTEFIVVHADDLFSALDVGDMNHSSPRLTEIFRTALSEDIFGYSE